MVGLEGISLVGERLRGVLELGGGLVDFSETATWSDGYFAIVILRELHGYDAAYLA